MIVIIAFQLGMAVSVLIRDSTIEKSKKNMCIMITLVIIFNVAEIVVIVVTGLFVKDEARTWVISID